jgi:hypothetical protein
MRSITKWPFVSLFASTKKQLFVFFSLKLHGSECRSLMRPIAKGLFFASATGTPEVGFSRLNFYKIGGLLRDNCLIVHNALQLFFTTTKLHELFLMTKLVCLSVSTA